MKKAQKVLKRDPDLASGVISKKEGKDGHSKSEKPHKKEDMFGPGKANWNSLTEISNYKKKMIKTDSGILKLIKVRIRIHNILF